MKKVKKKVYIKRVNKTQLHTDSGWYYVTITSFEKKCIFGEIVNDEVILNENGKIVKEEWLKSAKIRKEVQLDDFVIMPNHIHAIVMISQKQDAIKAASVKSPQRIEKRKFQQPKQLLEALVSGFKSSTTDRINDVHNTQNKVMWQRPYDQHTIRNKDDYGRIKKYIFDNPKNWENDIENVKN
jgi:putative transposase